jgi:methyltransferase (TIGR00027 family)
MRNEFHVERVEMARTDDDSWDLATSVGATATGVAVGRALASRGANPLIDDPFAEPLVRAVGVDFFTRLATGELDPAEVDGGAEWGMAQMAAMMAVRTKLIDDFFTDAAASGIRQAVILASGLDARAYRLGWPSGTTVYEIDQPEVIEFKTRTLHDIGAVPTAERRTVAIDLRQDWPSALRDAGFDAAQPTAWSAEGLLAFLPPEAQDRLLDNITGLSASGSRLVVENMGSGGDVATATQDRMREVVESWRRHGFDVEMTDLWYPGDRHDVAQYLNSHGWATSDTKMTDLFTANGFAAPESADDDGQDFDSFTSTTATRR